MSQPYKAETYRKHGHNAKKEGEPKLAVRSAFGTIYYSGLTMIGNGEYIATKFQAEKDAPVIELKEPIKFKLKPKEE